jgi:hypothetical protein
MLSIARRFTVIALAAAIAVVAMHAAPALAAPRYVCTADAIKAKKDFVVARFSDYLAGKYAKTSAFSGVMSKIWDGQGDCDTNGDIDGIVEKVPRAALLDFVTAHYYADIMSASADIAARKYADARPFIDDYKAIHDLITGGVRQAFNPDFFSQDRMLASAMRTYDVQVANNGTHSVVAGR